MEITITIKIDENEVVNLKTKGTDEVSDTSVSQYARFFDESSTFYENDPEYNRVFLRTVQAWANDRLAVKKHLFLNEVYEALGMEKTKAGQVVGWTYDNPIGDNYVDFGISGLKSSKSKGGAILLDFNVDGVILDKIY